MARKKKHEKEPNLERWLVSYADFITLLFAVFVTLYAMSQTDKQKVDQLVQSLRESFGTAKSASASQKINMLGTTDLRSIPSIQPVTLIPGPRPQGKRGDSSGTSRTHAEEKDFREIKTAIEAYLLKNKAQDKVTMEITGRGLTISLKEAGFFDSGSAVVKQSSYPLLTKIVESLTKYNNPLRIEGHTDNVPINSRTFPSNWELSTARATNIVHYLIDYYHFPPNKISASGYGEHRPIAGNSNEEGRGKNRRVDIVMQSKESETGEP